MSKIVSCFEFDVYTRLILFVVNINQSWKIIMSASGCYDLLGEIEPSEINTKNHPRFVEVSKDKCTVTYVGKGNHSDFGSVQSNVP